MELTKHQNVFLLLVSEERTEYWRSASERSNGSHVTHCNTMQYSVKIVWIKNDLKHNLALT